MTAPVLAGTGNPQLDVAVGHLSTSVWPGQPGTSVLAAHDVSYFSHISALALGSTIRFVTPCRTFLYKVMLRQVVKAGSLLHSYPPASRLVLETCYPLNALFFTPDRYLVTAGLTAVVSSSRALPPTPAPPVPPRVPAPPALAAQGLGLATNNLQLATLQFGGSPNPTWQQSAQPINDERSVIGDYDAAIRSAEQGQMGWWQRVAPGVPFAASSPLRDGRITEYTVAITPTLLVEGGQLTGATLNAGIRVRGGPSPGYYLLHATMADVHQTLVITGWRLAPGR